MKITISPSYLLIILILLIGNLSLCSFSLVPVPNKVEQPPSEKKKLSQEEKRQKHLQKRQNRLYERFEKAKTSKKRLFLQNKIRKVEQQQSSNPAFLTGLLSLLAGILGFLLLFLGIIAAFGGGWTTAAPFIWTSLVLVVAGQASAIWAMTLHKKNPEKSRLGLAITGMVFCTICLIIFLGVLIVAL